MIKKMMGVITLLAITLGLLGMDYPTENENKVVEDTFATEAIAATDRMVDIVDISQADAEAVQSQGAESIAVTADSEAIIQDSAVPLVASVAEASKRKTKLNDEEILLLQQVVSAESRGESLQAQYSVACVILNRMESEIFPNTLTEVVKQKGQFSCVPNGNIYRAPITDSVKLAVEMALDNNTIDSNVLWFRSSYYHSFHKNAFCEGRMYFSSL